MAVIKENVPGIEFPLQIDRQYGAPIDKYSVFYSQSNAEEYAKDSPLAYVGQIVVIVSSDDNSAKVFVITDTSGKLTELTNTDVSEAIKEEVLKECKAYTDDKSKEIDSKAQEYAENAKTEAIGVASAYSDQNLETGKAYTDSEITKAKTSVNEYSDSKNSELEETLNNTIENTKNELETTIEQKFGELANALVFKGVVNSNDDLPSDPKVGDTWKIGTSGVYAGITCEAGDLIIWSDQNEWVVVQANEDGIVTNPGESVDENLVIFDGVTGKRIKDSKVSKSSVVDTIDKAHTHANKDKLDTIDKTQSEILEYTDTKVSDLSNTVESNKSDIEIKLSDETNARENAVTELRTEDSKLQDSIGQVQENLTSAISDIEENLLTDNQALVYKGEISDSLPLSYKAGWIYHKIGNTQVFDGVEYSPGDFILALNSSVEIISHQETAVGKRSKDGTTYNDYLKLALSCNSYATTGRYVLNPDGELKLTLKQLGSVSDQDSSKGDFYYSGSNQNRILINSITLDFKSVEATTITTDLDPEEGTKEKGNSIITNGDSSTPKLYNITIKIPKESLIAGLISSARLVVRTTFQYRTRTLGIWSSWTNDGDANLTFGLDMQKSSTSDWSKISGLGTAWNDIPNT